MEDLELYRTDSYADEDGEEVNLYNEAIRITDEEHTNLCSSLEDEDYIPSYELQGTIMLWREELCVIAKGKNKNYFLIYI